MSLATLLNDYEDEITCDMAETYHIYDIASHDPLYIATLVLGLEGNSRLQKKIAGLKVDQGTLLIASCLDRLSMLLWTKTKDAEKGRNRPQSIATTLMDKKEEGGGLKKFNSPYEFEKERQRILKGA